MSALNPPYVSYIYTARESFTYQWLVSVLQNLWNHGVSFSPPPLVHATWDEQLASSEFDIQGVQAGSLQEALQFCLSKGCIYIAFWDGEIQYDLHLDPETACERREQEKFLAEAADDEQWKRDILEHLQEIDEREVIAQFVLYCDDTDHRRDTDPPSMIKERQYLRSYRGQLHWTKRLCEYFQPLFALNVPGAYHSISETESVDLWFQLARGEQPDPLHYLRLKGNCYLPPSMLTPALLTAALDIPTCIIERLSTGGVFCSVTHSPLSYEDNRAHWHYYMAMAQLQEGDPRIWTDKELKECMAHLQRAQDLFSRFGNTRGISSVKSWPLYIQEKLQEQ